MADLMRPLKASLKTGACPKKRKRTTHSVYELYRTNPAFNPLLNDSMEALTFAFEAFLEKGAPKPQGGQGLALAKDCGHSVRQSLAGGTPNASDGDRDASDGDQDMDECGSQHSHGKAFTKSIVCRYFLMGRCMMGSGCKFSHKMDEAKMDWCKFGVECKRRPDCPFIHIDQLDNAQDCEAYEAGFCPHGPVCKKHHIKKPVSELPRVGQAILDDIGAWAKRAEEEEKQKLYHKTSICRMWKEGKCRRSKCTFAHGYLDLSRKGVDRLEGRSWYVDPVSKEKLYLDGHSTWWKRADNTSRKLVKALI